jgi:hypothetical protein
MRQHEWFFLSARHAGLLADHRTPCTAYLGYSSQNKQVKCFVENLARYVDK